MILNSLRLNNFRNYKSLDIEFSDNINFITGNNGSGKTNILEAISIISNLKSFRNVSDTSIIKWNNTSYYCSGLVSGLDNSKFEVGFSSENDRSKKKIKIDSREIKKVSDYYGKLITVSFIPTDINIINGAPEIRRRYFDSVISKIFPKYIDELNRYRDICNSRNIILKKVRENKSDIKQLEVWNRLYAEKAVSIKKIRVSFVNEFNSFFIKNYTHIGNGDDQPKLEYSSSMRSNEYQNFLSEIETNIRLDIRRGSTLNGPHRDDYIIKNENGILFVNYASQGQKRTAGICLKLSEVGIIKEKKFKNSVILVDDIFSELDEKRRNNMIGLLKNEGQIIFTMVNNFYDRNSFVGSKHFSVNDGIVSERKGF